LLPGGEAVADGFPDNCHNHLIFKKINGKKRLG